MKRLAFVPLFVVVVALALALALLPGCSRGCGRSGAPRERLSVTVSIFPIYDLVRRIAGPDADVTMLVPPGRSAHAYEPTPTDIQIAARSRVAVMVGLGLDPWMEKLTSDAAPKARIIKVGDRVPTLEQDPDKGTADPHVWLDPERARLIVRAVAEELGKIDTPHAVDYRRRATEIDQSIEALDKEIDERTKALRTRGVVTFHGGFQYFAERYKLEVLAVVEPQPGKEPPAAHVAKVLEIIKAKKVPALFSEPQLDARPAKALADQAGIPLGVLDPLGGGPETDTYEKMLRFDMAQLEKYLR